MDYARICSVVIIESVRIQPVQEYGFLQGKVLSGAYDLELPRLRLRKFQICLYLILLETGTGAGYRKIVQQ